VTQYARPETGACDAICTSYGHNEPCSRYARWAVDGHHLCERHAELLVMDMAVAAGTVKALGFHKTSRVTFISSNSVLCVKTHSKEPAP